jgi:hypothetical protein
MLVNPFMSPSDSFTLLSSGRIPHSKLLQGFDLSEPDERGRQVLIMNVDIGDGRSDEITVHEYDEPDALAKLFCEKYSLSSQICTALSKQIEANIESILDEQLPLEEEPLAPDHMDNRTPNKPERRHRSSGSARSGYSNAANSRLNQPSQGQKGPPKKESVSSNSVGVRLYQQGMLMKRTLAEISNKKQREKEALETAELTFSPKIRRRGSGQLSRSPSPGTRSKSKDQRLQKIKEDLAYQEQVACTFKPDLCQGSRLLTKRRSFTALEKSAQLHREAKEQDERRRAAELIQ